MKIINKDMEVVDIVSDFPIDTLEPCRHEAANAYVCYNDKTGKLEIWPNHAGMLSVAVCYLQGDIAPWHG